MDWKKVGGWLKDNASEGTALIGSLMVGNIPGAVAIGASMVSQATGHGDPGKALEELQLNPEAMAKLKELYYKNEEDIREHHRALLELELNDIQQEHKETQQTIRNGDNSHDVVVRRTRPLQSWLSLIAALYYALFAPTPDVYILGLLLTLPWAYAGLRQIGKGVTAFTTMKQGATNGP